MAALVRTALVLLLASAMLLAGCTADTRSSPEADSATRTLRTAVEELSELPTGPPGVVVVVRRGSDRRVLRAGVADVETEGAPGAALHMRIASTAKAYSGAVVLSLVEDGVLSLDDTIGGRLPWAPDAWAAVTLRQLLHHTSGLPDFSADEDFLGHVVENLEHPLPPRRLLEFVTDQGLEFRAGSAYRYSNSDNVVAALMAQAATGSDYEVLLRDHVLRPLGLEHTSLPRGVRLPRPRMSGYDREPDGTPVDVSELIAAGYAWSSGGIVSTPADQNRFVRGYVGGALFDRPTQRAQFSWRSHATSEPPGPGTNAAGLAVFRYRTGCGTVYGHTGNTPGYTQFMASSRDGRRSVVVAVNRQTTPDVAPAVFGKLRRVFGLAVCAAYAG